MELQVGQPEGNYWGLGVLRPFTHPLYPSIGRRGGGTGGEVPSSIFDATTKSHDFLGTLVLSPRPRGFIWETPRSVGTR